MTRCRTQVRRIVIAGGGTAGWMAAAALSHALKRLPIDITLVESDEIGTIGVGEATIPVIHAFNNMLGIDQADFMRECQATFKLGIEFVDWGEVGRRYMHPFTVHGRDHENIYFHQLWLKYAHEEAAAGRRCDIDDYNLCSVAARANRFVHPVAGCNTGNAPLNYAFHFDASLYARYLRAFAENNGVRRIEGRIAHVHQDSGNGQVTALELTGGNRLEGDLFIDCTGLRGLLIAQTLGTEFEDWSTWLPCDRAIAVPSTSEAPPVPYTRSTADRAGWRWRIPLQQRVGNGYVYASRFLADDQAESRLLETLDGMVLAEPRHIRFAIGRTKQAWVGNCVALGLAAGFMEPLESTSIHLIQTAIIRLLAFFPYAEIDPVDVKEFNRQTASEYESIRDFLILHYKLSSRDDAAFWRYCRHMKVPDSLAERLELFLANGRVQVSGDELFTRPSWVSVLLGQTGLPKGYDPLADKMPTAELYAFMADVRSRIEGAVSGMPLHADYLRQFCAAERQPA